MKYIEVDKLIARIERLNSLVPYENNDRHDEGLHDAYKAVKNVIASLQQEMKLPDKYQTPDWLFKEQEQPEVDLEKEMDKYYGMYRDKNGKTYDPDNNEPCVDWKEVVMTGEHKLPFARHFYELGLNARKEENK